MKKENIIFFFFCTQNSITDNGESLLKTKSLSDCNLICDCRLATANAVQGWFLHRMCSTCCEIFYTLIFYKYREKKPNTKKSEKNRFSTFMCNKWVDKLRLGCKIACLFNGDFHNTSEFCRKQCFSIEYDFRCFHSGIQNRFTTHCYLLTYDDQDISHQKKNIEKKFHQKCLKI